MAYRHNDGGGESQSGRGNINDVVYRYGARIDNADDHVRFPPPSHYFGADPFAVPELFARAPWMDPIHVWDEELNLRYAHGDMLPGRLPFRTIMSKDWQDRCAVPKEHLLVRPHEDVYRKHVEFTRRVY